jgi:hypothetical protein
MMLNAGQEKDAPRPDLQHAIIDQVRAVTDSLEGSSTSETQQYIWRNTDLTTIDTNEHETSPPAYGWSHGEIRNEKEGHIAGVADDGRVNIRIDHLNRRLSQILTPALRQQLQGADSSHSAPLPPHIPAYLRSESGILPPPQLNVVMHVVGSRGGSYRMLRLRTRSLTLCKMFSLSWHSERCSKLLTAIAYA